VRRIAAQAPAFATSEGLRLYALPVVFGGKRYGSVVAGVARAPYDETRLTALLASLAFAAGLLVVVAFASWWLLSSALRPVRAMTRQADAWSEHDLDHRFDPGEPYDELTGLAATLDRLLDRLAASLRREQRFSAEVSHELRTPLARILVETELALRRERDPEDYRETLALVRQNARQLTRIVDALVAAARHEASGAHGTADAHAVATEAAHACAAVAAERGLEVELPAPQRPTRIGVDPELAERILQPVIENACRYGHSRVRVTVARDRGEVRFEVTDDGAGVRADEAEHIFEPGERGTVGRAANGAGGAGLGLALARRLARSARGELDVVAGGEGGRFVVRLPSA
jgi:signal transduction histidine kinase